MISFNSEETSFSPSGKLLLKRWIKEVIQSGSCTVGDVNYIFCSDDYLLSINRQYLSHDYYTDVITFDYVEDNRISGDIFISVDTVRANSEEYGTTFEDEMLRVMIHGVLHLMGYDDHEESDVAAMRAKEDECIDCYHKMKA